MVSTTSLFVLGLLMCFGSAVVSGQALSLEDVIVESGACRAGWRFHQGLCYGFINLVIKLSWPDAQAFCHSLGGAILAEPSSEDDNNFLKDMVYANDAGFGIWLGGTDAGPDKQWRWASTGEVMSPSFWNPGEPNNLGGLEHCIQMPSQPVARWNDLPCERPLNFICQEKA